jgi:hypothetical protein
VIKNVYGMSVKELTAHIRTLMGIRTDWGHPDTTAAISFNHERNTAFVRFDTQEECDQAEWHLEGARNTKIKSKGKGKALKVEKWTSDHTASKGKTRKKEEEAEAKQKQPRGNKPTREESIARAPWKSKPDAKKIITKAPAPSKPVVPDVEESNQSGSKSASPKRRKTDAKSGAKYGHIKTDTDDNGDTVVHITIKSTGKDKKNNRSSE